jgi:hypothetical protein
MHASLVLLLFLLLVFLGVVVFRRQVLVARDLEDMIVGIFTIDALQVVAGVLAVASAPWTAMKTRI